MLAVEQIFDPARQSPSYLEKSGLVVVGIQERYWCPGKPTVAPGLDQSIIAGPDGVVLTEITGSVIGHTDPTGALRSIFAALARARGLPRGSACSHDPTQGRVPGFPMQFYLTQEADNLRLSLPPDEVVGRIIEVPNDPDIWTLKFPHPGFGARDSMVATRQEVSGPTYSVLGEHLAALAVDGIVDSPEFSPTIRKQLPGWRGLSI